MTAYLVPLIWTLCNIAWSWHNRRREKELQRLQLWLIRQPLGPGEVDDQAAEDDEHDYLVEPEVVSA